MQECLPPGHAPRWCTAGANRTPPFMVNKVTAAKGTCTLFMPRKPPAALDHVLLAFGRYIGQALGVALCLV